MSGGDSQLLVEDIGVHINKIKYGLRTTDIQHCKGLHSFVGQDSPLRSIR